MGNNLDDLVDQEALGKFWDKVSEMARKEFGTDDEGKISKVQVQLIDRSRHWPMHYMLIPYDHKAKTFEEKEKILELLLMNLKTATDEMQAQINIFQDEKRMERAKREKEAKAAKA